MIYASVPNRNQGRKADALLAFGLRFGDDPRYEDYRHLSSKYPSRVLIGTDFMAQEAQFDEAYEIALRNGHKDIRDFLSCYPHIR